MSTPLHCRARSLAWRIENTRVSHDGRAGNTRHSPRNGFNGFLRALSGDRALLSPSPRNATHCRELTPASRRQDHTTSPSAPPVSAKRRRRAKAPFVFRHLRVHRIPPRVRDDREPPLLWDETRGLVEMICPTGKVENLFGQDWTAQISLNGFDKLGFTRKRGVSALALIPDLDPASSAFQNVLSRNRLG
jgi:hypothetical protein